MDTYCCFITMQMPLSCPAHFPSSVFLFGSSHVMFSSWGSKNRILLKGVNSKGKRCLSLARVHSCFKRSCCWGLAVFWMFIERNEKKIGERIRCMTYQALWISLLFSDWVLPRDKRRQKYLKCCFWESVFPPTALWVLVCREESSRSN